MTTNTRLDQATEQAPRPGMPKKNLVAAFEAVSPPGALPVLKLESDDQPDTENANTLDSPKDFYDLEKEREAASSQDISDFSNSWKGLNRKFKANQASPGNDENDPNDPNSEAHKEEERKEAEEQQRELSAMLDEMFESMQEDTERALSEWRGELEYHKKITKRAEDRVEESVIAVAHAEKAVTLATGNVKVAEIEHKVAVEEKKKAKDNLDADTKARNKKSGGTADNIDRSVSKESTNADKDSKSAAWAKHGAAIESEYAKAGLAKEYAIIKDADANKETPALRKASSEDLQKATNVIKAAGLALSPDEAMTRHLQKNDPQNPYLKTSDAKISIANDKSLIADRAEEFVKQRGEELKEKQQELKEKIAALETAKADLEKETKALNRLEKQIKDGEEFQAKMPELKKALKDGTITKAQFLEEMPDFLREKFLRKNPEFLKDAEKEQAATATPSKSRSLASESAANQVYGEAKSDKSSLSPVFARAHDNVTESTATPDIDPSRRPKLAQAGLSA